MVVSPYGVLWSPVLPVDDIFPGPQKGVFPEHPLFFSEQADPGAGVDSAWICRVDSVRHVFVPLGLCSLSLSPLSTIFDLKKSAPV